MDDQPPIGLTTGCRVVDVIDGDTLTVEITRQVRVRLLDCWAPETRTLDADEKAKGLAAKVKLESLVNGGEAVLFAPGSDRERVGDAFTFGRVLAYLFIDGENVSKAMVESGHAKEKP